MGIILKHTFWFIIILKSFLEVTSVSLLLVVDSKQIVRQEKEKLIRK